MSYSFDTPGPQCNENSPADEGSIPLPAALSFKPRVSPHLPANKEAAPMAKQISDSCPDGGLGSPNRFQCTFPDCDMVFSRRYNLKVHMRTHTKETPYRCPFRGCIKKYKWRSSLAHHTKMSHQKESDDMIQQIETEKVATRSAVMALTGMKIKKRNGEPAASKADKNGSTRKQAKVQKGSKKQNTQKTGKNKGATGKQGSLEVEGGAVEPSPVIVNECLENWPTGSTDWEKHLDTGLGYQVSGNGTMEVARNMGEMQSSAENAHVCDNRKKRTRMTNMTMAQSEDNVQVVGQEVPMSPVSAGENQPFMDATSLFPPDGRHLLSMGLMDFDMGNAGTEALGMENMNLFTGIPYGDARMAREFVPTPLVYYPYMMPPYGP